MQRFSATKKASRTLASATTLVLGVGLLPATLLMAPVASAADAPVGQGFNVDPADLKFILQQIKISEEHARTRTASNPCGTLRGDGPLRIPVGPQGELLPWGLRTVDGTCNNLVPTQERFGAADNHFRRLVPAKYSKADVAPPGFPSNGGTGRSDYALPGNVVDSSPRTVSNLVVDQTATNPAAVAAAGEGATPDDSGTLFIQNVATDVGLSAPYNSWFTLFGQFFDHGLDLVNKGGGGTVFVPLKEDDPLWATTPPQQRFMVVTRATGSPGETTNQTAPLVDQSQTYTSHPSHQVFLREYAAAPAGAPAKAVSTGLMLTGPDGGLATWKATKEQAAALLGIRLSDADVLNVPLLATDPYGRFLPGPNGYAQLVTATGLVEGNPLADANGDGRLGVDVPANATRTGHAFLDDIAHHANPAVVDHDHNPSTPRIAPAEDADPGTNDDGLATTYDNEMLDAHFVAGDGRVNENIGLTSVHHVFHSEHNRLAEDEGVAGSIKHVLTSEDPASVGEWMTNGAWNGERIFQAAKFITEMEYQHLAFEEFARKVQPMVNLFGEGGGGYDSELDPGIRAEFAHAVYRFGHSMLTEEVSRIPGPGSPATPSMPLIDAFLNPIAYTQGGTLTPEQAAGSVIRGMTRQTGNEIDEFVTEALRNNLLGLPLDLATINMGRARETGVPTLNAARRAFYAESTNSALAPYTSWADFGFSLKHSDSLANFVAAYGRHPSILAATTVADKRKAAKLIVANDAANPLTPPDSAAFMNGPAATTGVDDIDLWVGGLAEKRMVFGGLLGPTFNYVFEQQMEDLQFGDRFYYLSRTAGLNLLTQLEGNSFAELIHRNTDVSGLPADSFSRPDYVFNVGSLGTAGPIVDDPATEYDESLTTAEPGMHLSRVPAGTLRYSGPAHVVFNGTDPEVDPNTGAIVDDGADRIWSSEGDDTIRGNGGNDWVQGGDGVDQLIGGLGDDILQDLFGDDTLKGGDGHDAISSGQGFGGDLNQGGRGKDFIVGGNDMTETFAGPDDDFVFAGNGEDTVFGDDGDDWIEGGAGPFNLLQGDAGNPFQDDPHGGHDVLDGDGGEQDFDSEGGDDIGLAGPGIQRMEGMLGFDWFAHKGDPEAGDTDMEFTGLLPPSVDALRDRFDLTEGLSGWDHNDVLRGDDRIVDDIVAPGDAAIGDGHALNQAGIARIAGLQGVLGAGVTSFAGGNIILGGAGSDIIEGRGGDDIIDGDRWLNVRLSVRTNPANASTQTRTADTMSELQTDVFNGTVNPGNIVIVREILNSSNDADTAMFSDAIANYDCVVGSNAPARCPTTLSGQRVRVIHARGTQADGTDVLTGIERILFSDSAAPAAPTILGVAARNESALVTFDSPDGSVVNGFTVRALNSATGEVLRTQVVGADETSALITGLTNGTPVRFDVGAFNAFGPSAFSAPSGVVTPAATAPDAPGAPNASPGNARVTVSWTAPDSGGSAINGYQVHVYDAAGDPVGAARPASGTSLEVTGLSNGTAYRFAVQARNGVGNSAISALSTAVTPRTTPSTPVITEARATSRQATVSWSPAADGGSPLTGYVVRVITTSGEFVADLQAPANATSRNVPDLTNGTAYRFRVQAVTAVGSSEFSDLSDAVTPATVPGSPEIVGATAGEGRATVRWVPPTDNGGSRVTGYAVRVLDASGAVIENRDVAASETTLTVMGLVNGRAHQFRVRAVNINGAGEFSAPSAAVTPGTVPGTTRIGTATARNSSALVRWSAPLDNGGSLVSRYRIQVLNSSGGQVGRLRSASFAARSLLVTGLRNGQAYRFRVQAANAAGVGPFSTLSRTVRPAAPPARPVIRRASSGVVGGPVTAIARWAAPLSNGGARIRGYAVTAERVSRTGRVLSRVQSPALSPRARSWVTRLPKGRYQFRVVSWNAIGNGAASARSNRVAAR